MDVEALEGEAFVAATIAAKFFDPTGGVRFITYVTPWVRQRLIATTDPRAVIRAGSVT